MAELLGAAGFEMEEDLGPAQLNARFFAGRRDGLQIAGGGFRYPRFFAGRRDGLQIAGGGFRYPSAVKRA